MSWSNTFVELDKARHDRASFTCGEPELDDYIRTKAAKHMASFVSKTMLLPTADPLPNGKYPICTFYTVTPTSIEKESLPQALARKLPHYPVPVFLIAQLAVNSQYRGQGLGKIALVHALEYLYGVSRHMPAYAVLVDCLNESVQAFYAQYGFEALCMHKGKVRMYLPMSTVAQLFSPSAAPNTEAQEIGFVAR